MNYLYPYPNLLKFLFAVYYYIVTDSYFFTDSSYYIFALFICISMNHRKYVIFPVVKDGAFVAVGYFRETCHYLTHFINLFLRYLPNAHGIGVNANLPMRD